MIEVANAPVTFGVFELTQSAGDLPEPDDVAGAVAAADYDGIDLGPVGYLGREDIAGRLRRHGLSLAGGWVALRCNSRICFRVNSASKPKRAR